MYFLFNLFLCRITCLDLFIEDLPLDLKLIILQTKLINKLSTPSLLRLSQSVTFNCIVRTTTQQFDKSINPRVSFEYFALTRSYEDL